MNGKTILLVEDEKKVQDFNKRLLARAGFAVKTAMTLADARGILEQQAIDAMILDIGMPDGNGIDFLKELRRTSTIPVLMLTGYVESSYVLRGFDSGCDDYLTKPYKFTELLARLKRLLYRVEQVPETVTRGRLTLKPAPMIALLDGEDILLTQKEFSLLMLFAQNEDKTISTAYIYEKVWGREMMGDDRALQQRISNLREKIAESGYVIATVRGAGYRFERKP